MSHKFHGRGSGKKKTEKRMKKLQEEHVSHLILCIPAFFHDSFKYINDSNYTKWDIGMV